MAVIPALPGIEIEIQNPSDGSKFTEHDIDFDEDSDDEQSSDSQSSETKRLKESRRTTSSPTLESVIKYLEVPEGPDARFKICVKFIPHTPTRKYFYSHIRVNVYLDGKHVSSKKFWRECFSSDNDYEEWQSTLYGVRLRGESADNLFKDLFLFSALTIDSESGESPSKTKLAKSNQLGVLRVEVYNVYFFPREEERVKRRIRKAVRAAHNETVKPKSLKEWLLRHNLRRKDHREMGPNAYAVTRYSIYSNGKPAPSAVYVFHYHTLENLKKLGIVEGTPPPLEQVPFDLLTAEEKDILVRRYQIEYAERHGLPPPS